MARTKSAIPRASTAWADGVLLGSERCMPPMLRRGGDGLVGLQNDVECSAWTMLWAWSSLTAGSAPPEVGVCVKNPQL